MNIDHANELARYLKTTDESMSVTLSQVIERLTTFIKDNS